MLAIQAHSQEDQKAMQDSQGHLYSLRKAPPPAFVSAQWLHSERPGGTAAFPDTLAGLSDIAACSDHSRTTQSP